MLNLNYYFVDVGENYCTISEYNLILSLRDAVLNKDLVQLKLIKEYIRQSLKTKNSFSPVDEFKVVLVNKSDKMSIESEVEEVETHSIVEPLFDNENYTAYIMQPQHVLSIECQVVPHEIEHRFIRYEYIRSAAKRKRK